MNKHTTQLTLALAAAQVTAPTQTRVQFIPEPTVHRTRLSQLEPLNLTGISTGDPLHGRPWGAAFTEVDLTSADADALTTQLHLKRVPRAAPHVENVATKTTYLWGAALTKSRLRS